MVLKTFISGFPPNFTPSPFLPGAVIQSKWIAIQKWGCGSLLLNSRVGSHSALLSVVDNGRSGVLKITSFLPLPPPLSLLSYLEQSYLYPVGSPLPFSNFSPSPFESETTSLFPKFPPFPFHFVALSFRQVCCPLEQCPYRATVPPPF